ncbi:MAG TPA: rhodanese-like domain-containing protein [Saprospiraceae bacterium]|nr:rhodanese-like domain-containing protein [Saprospiraceae bacterium]
MINTIKKILGIGPKVDYAEMVRNGAIIIDVRSKGEYSHGHIKDSVNIPIDTLSSHLTKLKAKNKPVITCCASGTRSAFAKTLLQSNGFTHVYSGGSWSSLQNKIR